MVTFAVVIVVVVARTVAVALVVDVGAGVVIVIDASVVVDVVSAVASEDVVLCGIAVDDIVGKLELDNVTVVNVNPCVVGAGVVVERFAVKAVVDEEPVAAKVDEK